MRTRRQRTGLTLLEVVLAVTITLGLMGTVFWFYDHAASTRTAAIRQAEIIGAQRMIMDRMTDELRGAMAHRSLKVGLEGQAGSVEYFCARLPGAAAWIEPAAEAGPADPVSDLQYVGYRLRCWTDDDGVEQVEGLERTVRKAPPDTVEQEEDVEVSLLSEHIRFLSFSYWDGANWQSSWTGGDLPAAVEITMGLEPLPEDTDPEDYPYETFRRTVYVPSAGGPQRGGAAAAQPGRRGGR